MQHCPYATLLSYGLFLEPSEAFCMSCFQTLLVLIVLEPVVPPYTSRTSADSFFSCYPAQTQTLAYPTSTSPTSSFNVKTSAAKQDSMKKEDCEAGL